MLSRGSSFFSCMLIQKWVAEFLVFRLSLVVREGVATKRNAETFPFRGYKYFISCIMFFKNRRIMER